MAGYNICYHGIYYVAWHPLNGIIHMTAKSTALCYSLDLHITGSKIIKVYHYVKDDKDIEKQINANFEPIKVTNIKREKDYEGFLLKYENEYNKG